MLRRHFFLVGAVVVLVLMVAVGGWKLTLGRNTGPGGAMAAQKGPGGGFDATPVTLAQAQAKVFTDTVDVIGVAKGRQSVTLTAATTQLVERVLFTDGQSVPEGAILVELKATEQNAGLLQARARLVQAQRDYERWQQLAAQGFAAKSALDEREAVYLAAKADVTAAQAREGDRTIRAPFAGVVGLTDVAPGALINPGAPIVTLDDISTVRVDFQIPDRYLASIREGQSITARIDALPDATIQGRIQTLDTRVNEQTRAITARAEFPNANHRLRPGMMLRVSVAQGQRQVVAAPEAAVSVQGDSAYVYVITKKGEQTVSEQRVVLTGVRQNGLVEIRDGLKAGEQIVADGLNKIQPGQPLEILGSETRQKAAADLEPGARDARPEA